MVVTSQNGRIVKAYIRKDARRGWWDVFYGPGIAFRSFPKWADALAYVLGEQRNA